MCLRVYVLIHVMSFLSACSYISVDREHQEKNALSFESESSVRLRTPSSLDVVGKNELSEAAVSEDTVIPIVVNFENDDQTVEKVVFVKYKGYLVSQMCWPSNSQCLALRALRKVKELNIGTQIRQSNSLFLGAFLCRISEATLKSGQLSPNEETTFCKFADKSMIQTDALLSSALGADVL